MKKASRIIWGILILALGVILFGNAAKLWDVSVFFDGWWAAVVMILALFSIFSDKPNIVNIYFLVIAVNFFAFTHYIRKCSNALTFR